MWINCKVIGRHHTLVMKWSFHSAQLNFIKWLIINNIYHVFSPFFPPKNWNIQDRWLAGSFCCSHCTACLQWIESESSEPVAITCIHHVWKPFLKIYLEQWSRDRYTPNERYKYKTYWWASLCVQQRASASWAWMPSPCAGLHRVAFLSGNTGSWFLSLSQNEAEKKMYDRHQCLPLCLYSLHFSLSRQVIKKLGVLYSPPK